MNLPKRQPNRLKNYNYNQNGAYFVTICTRDRKKILSEIAVGTPVPGCPQAVLPQLLWYGQIAEKYIHEINAHYDHLSIDKSVIMPDHIHFLISLNGCDETGIVSADIDRTSVIARFVGTFKRFCNKEYKENIWQDRYYDHVIRNQQDYDETWKYIEYNPRKWLMKE